MGTIWGFKGSLARRAQGWGFPKRPRRPSEAQDWLLKLCGEAVVLRHHFADNERTLKRVLEEAAASPEEDAGGCQKMWLIIFSRYS